MDLGRTCPLAARAARFASAALGPAAAAQGRAEQRCCSQGRGTGPLAPRCLGWQGPPGPGSRAARSVPLCLTPRAGGRPGEAARAGTRGSCPCSAPHGMQGKAWAQSPQKAYGDPGRGAATPELLWVSPGSAVDQKGLALRQPSPFFLPPLLPAPVCNLGLYHCRAGWQSTTR